ERRWKCDDIKEGKDTLQMMPRGIQTNLPSSIRQESGQGLPLESTPLPIHDIDICKQEPDGWAVLLAAIGGFAIAGLVAGLTFICYLGYVLINLWLTRAGVI